MRTRIPFRQVFVLLILCIDLPSFAQIKQWVKQYPIGNCNSTGFYAISPWVVQSYDKGFYIVATDCLDDYIQLYKTDVNGNLLWQRVISQLPLPTLAGITSTADGSIVLSGTIYNWHYANDLFLMKLSPCGDIEWCKIYALNQVSSGGPVLELKNGNFIICASANVQYDTIINYYRSWIFCADAQGNLQWQRFGNQLWNSACIDKDENINIIGNDYDMGARSELKKINPVGADLWSSVYGIQQGILSQGIACGQTKDSGYLGLVSQVYSTAYTSTLIKYSADGNIQWGKYVNDTPVIEAPEDMVAMNDSTFLCFSITGNRFWFGNINFFEINDSGQVLKQFIYPNTGKPMGFYRLSQTSDNKFVAAGVLSNDSSNILVLKLNSNLELDSFYSNDTNKYDYLCGSAVKKNDTIQFPTDTVPVTIPYSGIATIPAKESLMTISAWPDPVTDNLQMEVKNPTGNNLSLHVSLTDNLGKIIIDQVVQAAPNGDMTQVMDMSTLAKGIYILSATDSINVLHKQTIVKQ